MLKYSTSFEHEDMEGGLNLEFYEYDESTVQSKYYYAMKGRWILLLGDRDKASLAESAFRR